MKFAGRATESNWKFQVRNIIVLWSKVNPHPPDVFFFKHILQSGGGGELLQLPPWVFYTERLIPLYLLPVYRYGPLLSIDTKISTIKLHMTSLWRHKISAPLQI